MTRKILIIIMLFLCASVKSLYAQPGMPPAKIVTSRSFEREIELTTQIVGLVDFDSIAEVASEVSGLVEEHAYHEGDLISKGDVLVRLSTDFIKKDIEILQKQVEVIDVKIEQAKKNLDRLEKLFENSATSEKEYDDEYYLLNELSKQKEELYKQIEKLQLNLDKSVIRAPFDGIIMENMAEIGEWVGNQTPVCALAATDAVYVKVPVSEDLLIYLSKGKTVHLSIPALDKELQGSIDRIIPLADLKSKTLYVMIKIPYAERTIQNMSARVAVPSSKKQRLIMVKRDALVTMNDTNFIYVVENNTAKLLPVAVVSYQGEYVGIKSGAVVADMAVVVDGNDRLQPGQPVTVVGEN